MILILHVKKQRAFATGTEWRRSTVFPLLCGGLPDSGFELRGFSIVDMGMTAFGAKASSI
jgi:hypothetical protein